MKRIITVLIILVLAGAAFTACSKMRGGSENPLQITDAWARPGQAGATSAVYFVINNGGDEDTLLSASTSSAERAELHMSRMEGDTMMMQPQENVPLPEKSTVEFKPGGLHIMLVNLRKNITAGENLIISLNFEKAGTIQIEAPVR